jgi:nucleotide-binding universal stress UspA family protein
MISVRRILCPTDFSALSARAVEHAVTLARWYEAEVTVLHVAPLPMAPLADLAYVPAGGLTPANRERLRGELYAFVEPVRKEGVKIRLELGEGIPSREILARAYAHEADLLVLGTRGRHGLQRWVLGSVTEHVLRRAPCPVLTVSPAAETLPSARFETVLCPVDFSPTSAQTVHAASALAEEAQARLVLLHVIEGSTYPPIRVPPGFDVATYRKEVATEVSGRLWRLLPEGGGATEVAVTWGAPHHQIVRQARERHAGLVVIGAHGGALDSALLGSTSHCVVRRASCPVLVLRARAHAFDERAPEPVGAFADGD